jgi:hypothetical protein
MYKNSSTLKIPINSQQKLWRYFSYERLKDLLLSEEIFFTDIRAFDDGLEGSLTARTRDRLFDWFQSQGNDAVIAHGSVKQYENHSEAFFVNCWHMNDGESYLMWKAYAERGFAVRTTFERLQSSFDNFPGEVTGGIVNYVDFEREITPLGNVFNHVITKDLPYRDEREFRLLFWRTAKANQNIMLGEKGIKIRVDLKMLIESIYLNPIETTEHEELCQILDEKDIKYSTSLIKHQNC